VALVLCTGVDPILLQTRKLILEQAGHTVITARSQQELTAACNQYQFDVAVIGQTVSVNMKRIIAGLIREQCRSVKILELHGRYESRSVPDADSWLETPTDIPRDLSSRVTELAEKKKQGGASA
jgi:CheY-like chemotaxis protein